LNSRTDTFIISSYGNKIVYSLALLSAIFILFFGFKFITIIVLAFFICAVYTFRNPERSSNFSQNGAIMAVVDGKVKEIKSVEASSADEKPYFEIVIESGLSDVTILRSPIDSKMSLEKLTHGAMLNSKSSLSNLNETADIIFESKKGKILTRHTLGSWARPLQFAIDGDISQNQRYGFMHNGITSIFLPSNSRVAVKEGMKLRAGESVVGFFSE